MSQKGKNVYKFSFISMYYFVILFFIEEYIRLKEINLVLVILFFFQNIVLFLATLIEKNKTGDE